MGNKQRNYTYEEYMRAMKLLNDGLGPTEICKILGWPTTRKSTVSGWKNGRHKPSTTRWVPEPSNELAYVLGVLYGDGNLERHGYNYDIKLNTIDLEFAEVFSNKLAKLLNKKILKPKWIGRVRGRNYGWKVSYSSKAFYTWFKRQNLESLKQYIEYSKETVANFLRGLYDSDGGHYKYMGRYSRIQLYNNNTDLLHYIQYLLEKYFGIKATGPYLCTKAGTFMERNGKKYRRNGNTYRIDISRKQYIQKFLNEIGFSIKEKQFGLPRRKRSP